MDSTEGSTGTSVMPELVDFDMRGLSEPIRYLLAYWQVNFQDTRIPFKGTGEDYADNWGNQKYNHSLDFPSVPFYSDDTVKLTDSLAIMRHIARKYNLCGETPKEIATIEMVESVANELRWGLFVVATASNYHDIEADYKSTTPARLGEINNFMGSKQFVVGDKLTYVDFLLFETLDCYRVLSPESFDDPLLGNLKGFLKRIEEIPEIQKYRSTAEFEARPLFSPVARFGFSQDANYSPIPFSYRNYVAKYPIDTEEFY